jgi:hypothetical protein
MRLVRATLRIIFWVRRRLGFPRSFFDLRLCAANLAADYAELRAEKQERNRELCGWPKKLSGRRGTPRC